METFSALLAICAENSPVPVNSPHKGQWRGTLMFSLICVWINDWVNNGEAGDLRRYRIHYDVTVMNARRHDVTEMLSALLTLCEGIHRSPIDSLHKESIIRIFHIFSFHAVEKQSSCRCSCDVTVSILKSDYLHTEAMPNSCPALQYKHSAFRSHSLSLVLCRGHSNCKTLWNNYELCCCYHKGPGHKRTSKLFNF